MSPNSPLSPSDADDDARRADALLRVLGRRRDILVAVGIVMTTDDVDADEALATLEALARERGIGVDAQAEYLSRFPSGPAR